MKKALLTYQPCEVAVYKFNAHCGWFDNGINVSI